MAIALEQTRVNFSPTSRVAFLRLHNSGEQPLFFTASIENNPCQSCPETSAAPHFVVTPASGVIAPHRPLQLRVVRTGNTLAADRETLASLALRRPGQSIARHARYGAPAERHAASREGL